MFSRNAVALVLAAVALQAAAWQPYGSESRMVRRAVPAAPAPAAVPPAQGAAGAVTTTTTSGSPPATVPGTAPKTDGASTGKSKQHKAPHPPRTYDQQVAHIKKLEAHLAKEKAKLAKMKQGTTTANSTPNVAGNPAVGVTPATPGAPNPGAKVQKRGHSGRKTHDDHEEEDEDEDEDEEDEERPSRGHKYKQRLRKHASRKELDARADGGEWDELD